MTSGLVLFAVKLFLMLASDVVVPPDHDLPAATRIGKAIILPDQPSAASHFDVDHVDGAWIHGSPIGGWRPRYRKLPHQVFAIYDFRGEQAFR